MKTSKKLVSYQKNDGHGHARPSFFWYDTNFLDVFIFEKKNEK